MAREVHPEGVQGFFDIDQLLEGQDLEKLPKIQKDISRARRKLQYLRSQ